MADIDIVVTWVDGNDPAWRAEKAQFDPSPDKDVSLIRYRDWDLLRYWFRGIDRFAPWCRTVHFITWGHLPPWLDRNAPKLHIVNHQDYMPADALPSFNSNAIELGMHRIDGLAEQFVYFNDDMFLLRPTTPETFFRGGLPCDDAILSPVIADWEGGRSTLNNMFVINRHFDKGQVMGARRGQWYNLRYGKQLLRTLCLSPWHHFTGFFDDHLPQPFLKSTFEAVWQAEPALMDEVVHHRFRDYRGDVSQWLMRYWQFCTGSFDPASPARGRDLSITDPATPDVIREGRIGMICINDQEDIADFDGLQRTIQGAFEHLLPGKSSFEA